MGGGVKLMDQPNLTSSEIWFAIILTSVDQYIVLIVICELKIVLITTVRIISIYYWEKFVNILDPHVVTYGPKMLPNQIPMV